MTERKKGWAVVAGVLGCLAAGAGLEHLRRSFVAEGEDELSAAEPQTVVLQQPAKTATVTYDAAARAENEALRRRIAELQQALAARESEPVPAEPRPSEEAPREERPRRQSFSERLEQMKKENPEQYAEMQKRREEFRQSMEQRAQDRANFLSAVETQNMTEEQQANHEKLLETVARVNELMAQMGQADGERSSDLRHEMGEAIHTLSELYGTERRYLFEETARAVGYADDQVSVFADHMQSIIDNTTMSGFGRHGGPRNAPPPADGAAAAAGGTR